MEPVRINHFSDVLCVWSYIAQRRVDELHEEFGDKVELDAHFLLVFGNTAKKIQSRWADRGGWSGYNAFVRQLGERFDHVTIHPDVWQKVQPTSSLPAHIMLSAVCLLEQRGRISSEFSGSALRQATGAVREAFFAELTDVSKRSVLLEVIDKLGYPVDEVVALVDSGEAQARLTDDLELAREYGIDVSPALVFNEGRQRLIGNVGYRIIDANIRELLHNPANLKAWC